MRPRLRLLAAVTAVLAATAGAAGGALAAPALPSSPAPASRPLQDDPATDGDPLVSVGEDDPTFANIDPALAGVRVTGNAVSRVEARFDETVAALDAATALRTGAEAELASLSQREAELDTAIADGTERRKVAALRLSEARRDLREVAVSSYISSANDSTLTAVLEPDEATRVRSGQVLSDAVREDRTRAHDAARVEVAEANDALVAARDEREAVRTRTAEVTATQATAAADEARLTTEVGELMVEVAQARATSAVAGLDFTLVALDAYVKAAATQPQCGIQWWAIAGVSRVEGRHGTFGGRRLYANGDVDSPIVGIALTGEGATSFIGDSDGGLLDGDPAFDRAVGPMQFIPTTWARWGRDGDGDGDIDPQNLYDATAAAAAYLCAGRTLLTEDDLRAAYFSYNRSPAYVEQVLAHALEYAQFVIPAPPTRR